MKGEQNRQLSADTGVEEVELLNSAEVIAFKISHSV